MKYPKRNTKLWSYLNQNGFLESNNEIDIQNAIKQYYRDYDRELKKRKRSIEKREFSISFPKHRMNHILKRSRDYNTTVVDYLKLLVEGDLSKASPLKFTVMYKEILQLLRHYKNAIDTIESKENNRWFGNNNFQALHKILSSIKDKIDINK